MSPDLLLQDLRKALVLLEEAVREKSDLKVVQAGCIQYFEFTFELMWKWLKKRGEELGIEAMVSPRAVLQKGFELGWIEEEEVWLKMLKSRNLMSHTYDPLEAMAVYDDLPLFAAALRRAVDQTS